MISEGFLFMCVCLLILNRIPLCESKKKVSLVTVSEGELWCGVPTFLLYMDIIELDKYDFSVIHPHIFFFLSEVGWQHAKQFVPDFPQQPFPSPPGGSWGIPRADGIYFGTYSGNEIFLITTQSPYDHSRGSENISTWKLKAFPPQLLSWPQRFRYNTRITVDAAPTHPSISRSVPPSLVAPEQLNPFTLGKLERAIHRFPPESHGLRFGDADSHPRVSRMQSKTFPAYLR